MSSFYLILALVFSLIIAIAAIANTEPVTVNYIFGQASVSLIILILGSAFAGAMVMGMISLFRSIRSALAFRQARHEKEALEKQIKELEEEKIFLQAELNKALSVPEETEVNAREIEMDTGEEGPGGEMSNQESNQKTDEDSDEEVDEEPK